MAEEVTAHAAPAAEQGGDAHRQHVPVLDGIRGLAILLVMQYHFWGLTFGLASRDPSNSIDRFAQKLMGVGWSGVDLFFVLSGFLITGILYDAKHSNGFFRNFYGRRFLRIFPAYYLFLAFVLLVLPNFSRLAGPGHVEQLKDTQWWYWSYTTNFAASIKAFDTDLSLVHSQFWSLALEEQFYFVWPVLVLLFSRQKMMVLCCALVAGALATRIFLETPLGTSFSTVAGPHTLLPARVDTLALGALLALALRSGIDLAKYRRQGLLIGAAALAVLTVLFVTQHGLTPTARPVAIAGLSALALLYSALLLVVITSKVGDGLHAVFVHPALRFLGRYSYAIYVIHLLVAFELAAEVIRRDAERTVLGSQIPVNVAFNLGCSAVAILAAWVSWHLIEKQFLKLKRYFPYGNRAPRKDRPIGTALEPGPARVGS